MVSTLLPLNVSSTPLASRLLFLEISTSIILFGGGGSSQSSLSENFVDWLNDSDFSLLNTSAPTHISNPHTSSIIDLTLCSASIYNEIDCYVFDCTFESDHIPIVISWSEFQNTTHTIKTINWKPIIKTSIDIFNTTSQPSIDLITDQISRTISAHTANKILVDKDYPPWWNAACHNFSHLKKLAWNKARSIANTEWIKYKKYRSKFKYHFKKAKDNYWDSISQISRNPRMFFKILNKLSSHTNPNVKNHEIIFHNNRYVTNPITQSNLFANHFSSYSHEVQPIPLDYSTENEFLNRNIEFWELKRAISKTKNSTPGADSIPSIWFKKLDDASLLKILGMLQQQLDSSVLPKIPGHSGVSWNEKADSIAKQVSDSSPYIDWIASEDILSHLKKQSFQITEEKYHKSKYQLLIGNFPDILTISKWTGNRVQDRLIARIISKTITTPGLLSRFNLHPDPLCRVCNEINDISHILLRCQKYASVRVTLWRKLNIASANITYDVLLSHVLVNKNTLLIFVQTLKYFDID
ncbi:hypothetical protein AVEN_29169-1 [Araneus ventricosus]|uniref:Endonuclease/exonuclease/phosphatase domain-containing protein n=1 Tax=Araneus ventricosus TaxID=182803 RepID=A0A4Y2AK17_ARAVE|nr:hypothetical protein AVEN_29169-1 [Araneus ventricosus]